MFNMAPNLQSVFSESIAPSLPAKPHHISGGRAFLLLRLLREGYIGIQKSMTPGWKVWIWLSLGIWQSLNSLL